MVPAVSPAKQLPADGRQALEGGQHLVRLRQRLKGRVGAGGGRKEVRRRERGRWKERGREGKWFACQLGGGATI